MLIMIFFLIGSGMLTGFLAGLLGTGGTMFLAPIMLICLNYLNIDPTRHMQIALGSSLAIMIFSSFAAYKYHKKLKNIDFSIVKLGLVAVIPLLILGSVVSDWLPSRTLQYCFGIYLVVVSMRLFYVIFTAHKVVREERTMGKVSKITMGGILGFCSGLLGVGGSSITVPYMMQYNIPQRVIGGTTTMFTVVATIIGTMCYIYNGVTEPHMTHSFWTIGYVMWPAVLFMTPFSMWFAKYGAILSKKLDDRVLKLILAAMFVFLGMSMIV